MGDNTYIEGTHTHDSDSGKEIMTAAETKIEEEHKGFFGIVHKPENTMKKVYSQFI